MRNATDANVLHYSQRQRVADVEVVGGVRCEVPFCISGAGIGLREPVSLAFTASCYPNGSNASGPFAWLEVSATCPRQEMTEGNEDASWQRRHNLVMGEQKVDKDKETAYFQFRCVSIDR
jgi:hypothetical protein